MTGHLLGATGAIEAIAAIKSVQTDIVPPTINAVEIEPEFKDVFDLTLGKAVRKKVNYSMNNFGTGILPQPSLKNTRNKIRN